MTIASENICILGEEKLHGCLPMTPYLTPVYIGVRAIPSGFDTNWHSWFWHPNLTPSLTFRTPRRVLRARQGMLTLHEHLIPLLFCKGDRGFKAFVLFVYVLSIGLFLIFLTSLDYALLISRMGIITGLHHLLIIDGWKLR